MLFKWFLLLLIAWYASKALGNLILTLRGIPIEQQRPTEPVRQTKREISKQPQYKSEVSKAKEIEDARFEDL